MTQNKPSPLRVDSDELVDVTEAIISFIRNIGIAVHEDIIIEDTFLPGILIRNGELTIDKKKMLYPGDLLHEAGHIAVTPADERPEVDEERIKASAHRDAEEMMAIAWSYAACVHLAIDPLIVFHEHGYKGGGESIAENFQQKRYFGVPMLQWVGLTVDEKRSVELKVAPYPIMIKWLR